MINKKTDHKYVSPFIIKATKIAEVRSKEALKLKHKASCVNKEKNQWDTNTEVLGLFDPNLRKQEIFKLKPRKSESESIVASHKVANKMTIKNTGVKKNINYNNNYFYFNSILIMYNI
jgi:hypothetical protein